MPLNIIAYFKLWGWVIGLHTKVHHLHVQTNMGHETVSLVDHIVQSHRLRIIQHGTHVIDKSAIWYWMEKFVFWEVDLAYSILSVLYIPIYYIEEVSIVTMTPWGYLYVRFHVAHGFLPAFTFHDNSQSRCNATS